MTISRLTDHLDSVRAKVGARKQFIAGNFNLTYGELFNRIGQASGFFKENDLKVGDRIVICSANELETAVLYLATLYCGLTAVFIDPRGSLSETILLLDASKPRAIIMDEKLLRDVDAATGDSEIKLFHISPPQEKHSRMKFGLLLKKKPTNDSDSSYQAITAKQTTDIRRLGDIPEDTTALILFTSGTTSRPKGVELTFKNIFAQFNTFKNQYGFDQNSRIMNHLPLHHTDGLALASGICLFTGATWIRPQALSMNTLPDIMDVLYREDATHLITVPTVLGLILRMSSEFDDAFENQNFRFVGSTAGFLDETLWSDFEARFKVPIVNSYGLTETVSEAIYCGPDEETRRKGTIGKPRDCEAKIVDEAGKEVSSGEIGELLLRGDNIMKGYFRNPEATNEVFIDGWFRTGDLATKDNDGFYSIAGRKKNLIIRAGINVYPDDVTHCITQMPGVLDGVTFGLPDELLGEKVISCITLDDTRKISVQDVVDHCREQLAYEKIPNDIHILDELPRGPAGKVLLNEIKAVVRKKEEQSSDSDQGSITDRLLNVAALVFKVPVGSLSVESSDKTTAGWDSLSHLELVMALENHFSIKLGPRDIMNITTLGNVVHIIQDKVTLE